MNYKTINPSLLRLYGAVLAQPEAQLSNSKREQNDECVAELLCDYFTFVTPQAQYDAETIWRFIRRTKLHGYNLNATFYRSWKDVVTKTRKELLIDQLLHYSSTYGSEFQLPAYIPALDVKLDLGSPDRAVDFTSIDVISVEEACEKTRALLVGGTALNENTVRDVVQIMSCLPVNVPAQSIRNKEVRALLIACKMESSSSVQEFDPDDVLRAIVYVCTKSLLVIKSKTALSKINFSGKSISELLQDYDLAKLAQVFNRHKHIFMALKEANEDNKKIINRISKLSKSRHKPLVDNPMNSVTHRELLDFELHWLRNATVAAQLRALNACKLAIEEPPAQRYRIRNGKLWVSDRLRAPSSLEAARKNYDTILSHLKDTIGQKVKGKRVFVPQWIKYGLPMSEKSALGPVPYNSKFLLSSAQGLAIGVFWKKEYEAKDLDLAGRTLDGKTISWNCTYQSGSFVYSGDVTTPGPDGATEYLLAKPAGDLCADESLQIDVHAYSASPNYEFDIIVGTGDNIDEAYMMHPGNLLLNFHAKESERHTTIGYVMRSKETTEFILSPGAKGKDTVAGIRSNRLQKLSEQAMEHLLKHSLSLNELLELLGATLVSDRIEGQEIDIDLDINKLNKDLFTLFEDAPSDHGSQNEESFIVI